MVCKYKSSRIRICHWNLTLPVVFNHAKYLPVCRGWQVDVVKCDLDLKEMKALTLGLALADFTLAVTDVRTGTTGAAWASCRARQISLMSTCVPSASPQRMPWLCSVPSQIKTMRAWGGSCAPCRWGQRVAAPGSVKSLWVWEERVISPS